jgi:hypothetical protein
LPILVRLESLTYGFDGGMLPGAGVVGANVLGPGDTVLGVGARLGAGVGLGANTAPGVGDSIGAPPGVVTIGAETPSEP